MTDIGAKLISLIRDTPQDWEYAPMCHGIRHLPTKTLISPVSIGPSVILMIDGEIQSELLDADDHPAVYAVAEPLTTKLKNPNDLTKLSRARAILGLPPNEPDSVPPLR